MIDLSIIIPTLNRSDNPERDANIGRALRECIVSLQETCKVPIIVASNNGEPKSLPIETGSQVKRINIYDQGQCKAVNAAVAMTNTEWIMVSNDDMVYPPQWLDWVELGILDSNGCLSTTLVEPIDGAPTFIKHYCGGAMNDFEKQKFLDFVRNYKIEISSMAFGFNLPFIMKREVWDLVGGYDINYDPWSSNSDSDLLYKLKLAGIQPMQNRNCLVYHFSQTSGTQHPSNRGLWSKNWQYFEKKWGFTRIGSPEIWTTDFEIDYKKLKFRPKWAVLP